MKRLLIIVLLLAPGYLLHAEEEQIADINEEAAVYEKGEFAAGSEGNTLSVIKGEGFDFKVPEILITGKIDTKIMLKREITSLEDITDVKNLLYEKEKINMPDYYLKEEELTPQRLEMAANKDFTGRVKLSAGSYTRIFGEGAIGKSFDEDNTLILKASHLNSDNEIINDRRTKSNDTSGFLYYSTLYDDLRAAYFINGSLFNSENPYTGTMFGNLFRAGGAEAGATLASELRGIRIKGLLKYMYFEQGGSISALYRENTASGLMNAEGGFKAGSGRDIKIVLNTGADISSVTTPGLSYKSVFTGNLLLKGIFYFEPFVMQAGIKLQGHHLEKTFFRASPYLNLNIDAASNAAIYLEFKPEMHVPVYREFLKRPFTFFNPVLEMPVDSINLKTGLYLNYYGVFTDVYYGYMSTENSIITAAIPVQQAHTMANNSMDYGFAGINIETLRLENFTVKAGYRYNNLAEWEIIKPTYFAFNEFTVSFLYEKAEWEIEAKTSGKSAASAGPGMDIPAYIDLDAGISRDINENLRVFAYINNILNNEQYLLYWYLEKGFNLGAGIELKF